MARPKHTDRPRRVLITIPESLYTDVKVLALDPVYGRSKYGLISSLCEVALREWVDKQRKEYKEDVGI